jgi:cell wall assembly regulator SMI1
MSPAIKRTPEGDNLVQKFTRALTREIELAGQRLKLTLDENGITISQVGSRRPPREISWAALIAQMSTAESREPDATALASALDSLKSGPAARQPARTAASPQPKSTQEVTPILDRLEQWLKANRPHYLEALRPGASEDDFVALRGSLGAAVPNELRQLLSWHNGQAEDFSGAFEGSWSLMSAEQIGAAKRGLDAQAGDGRSGWQPACVPFLDNDEGDCLCLDPSLPGTPVRQYRQTSAEAPTIAPSLTAWLNNFVTRVEAGKYHEDPERGQFLQERE